MSVTISVYRCPKCRGVVRGKRALDCNGTEQKPHKPVTMKEAAAGLKSTGGLVLT